MSLVQYSYQDVYAEQNNIYPQRVFNNYEYMYVTVL